MKVPVPGAAAAGVRERQRIFESEDALQRRLSVLDRTTLLQEALATAPRRPPTPQAAAACGCAPSAPRPPSPAPTGGAGARSTTGVLAEVDPGGPSWGK
ncbi:hypothetical protein ACLESD_53745, partial [Pyxidicoccus sp. 3LFB2]